MLAVSVQINYQILTFDVKAAFLYGELEEPVFMKIPEGYKEESKICKLKKALFGLRQASLKWNQLPTSFLKEKILSQLKTEQCVFEDAKYEIFLAIYVDDGILIGKDINEMKKPLN